MVKSNLGQLEVRAWPPGTEGNHEKTQALVRIVSYLAKDSNWAAKNTSLMYTRICIQTSLHFAIALLVCWSFYFISFCGGLLGLLVTNIIPWQKTLGNTSQLGLKFLWL
jgi:hypothetical protein